MERALLFMYKLPAPPNPPKTNLKKNVIIPMADLFSKEFEYLVIILCSKAS